MQILLIMLIVVLLAFSVLLLALAKQSPREKQTEDKEQEEYIRDYAETVRQTGGSMKKLEHWKTASNLAQNFPDPLDSWILVILLIPLYISHVQIVLDFGFILSATQVISENRSDKILASNVISSVSIIKIILSLIVASIFLILFCGDFFDSTNASIIFIYLVAYLFNALLPDYYYRGIEDMKITSIRTVVIRVIFTILIFIYVKNENDYIFVPISFLVGSICALFFSILDIKIRYKITYNIPKLSYIKKFFVSSIPFFVSRFASTFYQALNVIILGKIYGNSPVVGYYTSSDKMITLSKMASSPIADSLYPYMLKNKNFRIVKKILVM